MTAFDPLLAVGALDGRYRARVAAFAEFCGGEAALIRARVEIEIEWLLCLLREDLAWPRRKVSHRRIRARQDRSRQQEL